jgi:2-oxoglutarate dehydrogenase E1 component
MLICAYRVMGHLPPTDPLGLTERKIHKELRPETYGFTDADLDRPIFIDKVLGLEIATVRDILKILRRTYRRQVGPVMHITAGAVLIQERMRVGKDIISPTTSGHPQQVDGGRDLREVRRRQIHGTKRFG